MDASSNWNKQQVIENGKALLDKQIFPDEILASIKDNRLRKEISDAIFYPEGRGKFTELADRVKQKRALVLPVQLAYIQFISASQAIKYSSILYVLFAIVIFCMAILAGNSNEKFAYLTGFQGIGLGFLFHTSLSLKTKYDLIWQFIVATTFFEFVLFQFPTPILTGDYGRLSITYFYILNVTDFISPHLYYAIKMGLAYSMYLQVKKINLFLKAKSIFQNG